MLVVTTAVTSGFAATARRCMNGALMVRRLVVTLLLLWAILGPVPSWAAIAFVQGKNAEEVDTLSDDVAFTWDSNTTAGNAIVCGVQSVIGATSPLTGITDSQSNVYVLGPVTIGPFGIDIRIAYALNITGGTTPTVTATYADGSTQRSMSCGEFSGVAKTGALDQQTGQAQTNPGTGTDAVTSGNMTTEQANELIFGTTCCFGNGTPSAGTNFTKFPASDVSNKTEYRIVSSIGSYAATFTTTDATDDFGTRGATFKEAPPACRGHLLLMGIGGC